MWVRPYQNTGLVERFMLVQSRKFSAHLWFCTRRRHSKPSAACILFVFQERSPEILASFPCFITYQWMQPIMSRGYRKHKQGDGLCVTDLYKLTPEDTAAVYFPPFETDINEGLKKYRDRWFIIIIPPLTDEISLFVLTIPSSKVSSS